MPEFNNPSDTKRARLSPFVIFTFLLVCVVLGFPSIYGRSTLTTFLPQRQAVAIQKGSPKPASDLSAMNFLERSLFRRLALVRSCAVLSRSGSWGWAIILFTAAINLLLLPIRLAGMRSGMKMQRLQPAMNLIKARYQGIKMNDPRRAEMNEEIARLQKDNGVNVFGGCLPLLVQMPLLIAFFGMLRKAPALHGASWLWLHDLSVADPSHVLPVLMTVSQLAVQMYTPSPGVEAKQQRMMACMMTVGFGYVSWHYSAGLALYALTGSLLSLAIQAVLNITQLGRQMKSARAGAR